MEQNRRHVIPGIVPELFINTSTCEFLIWTTPKIGTPFDMAEAFFYLLNSCLRTQVSYAFCIISAARRDATRKKLKSIPGIHIMLMYVV